MALQLKHYQEEALIALSRFFDLARGARDEAGLDAAFRQALLDQEIAPQSIRPIWARVSSTTRGQRLMSVSAFLPAAARRCSVRMRWQ